MLADLGQLDDSAEEFIHCGEEPQWSGDNWLDVDRGHRGDSVVLTSPQLPLLMPELNDVDCILAQI